MAEIERNNRLLFLETTIQIDRIIGTQERRDHISADTKDRVLATSGHVLGEFNRTLIKDAITFRDLILSSSSVEDAGKRLPSYVHSDRKYKRTVNLLLTLGFDQDKQNTLDRLEKFIEWQGYDHFWEGIEESCYTDEVQCVLKAWFPELDDEGKYDTNGLKCLKGNPPPCVVQAFIEKHREELEAFAKDAKNHDRPNVSKAASAFSGILSGTDVPFGERSNCYPISDTLITLEANTDAEIYSTDGDVHAICEMLDRPIYTETQVSSSDVM